YKIELPKDYKLPDGLDFKLATVDDPVKGPALKAAQEWAHRKGLSQSDFAELVGLYVGAQTRELSMVGAAAAAEREALGVNAPIRVDAISNWLRARYGDNVAKPILATMVSRHHVAVFEDIIQRFTNQGGGNFTGARRDAEPMTLSQAQWDTMSYTEKKDYSERASAQAASRGRR